MSEYRSSRPAGPHPDSVVGYYCDAVGSATTAAFVTALSVSPDLALKPKIAAGGFLAGASYHWGKRAKNGFAAKNAARIENANGLSPAMRFVHKAQAAAVNVAGVAIAAPLGYVTYKTGVVQSLVDGSATLSNGGQLVGTISAGVALNVLAITTGIGSAYRAHLMN